MTLTKELLEQFRAIKREIKRLEQKLKYYEQHPLSATHGVVKGSMKAFPYAEKHFVLSAPDVKSDEERNKRVSQLIIDLSNKKSQYEQLAFEIDMAIEDVEDIEMRQILQYKYIYGMTDAKIADEMGYERSTITKRINDFTQITF